MIAALGVCFAFHFFYLFATGASHRMISRRRFHRAVFLAARVSTSSGECGRPSTPSGCSGLPGLPLANYPGNFVCLGMVIGLYGILYLEVARVPERGWLIAAVGLTGKIMGPVGLLVLMVRGEWPIATFVLCVTNDLIWWLPFGLYLKDSWPHFKRARCGRSCDGPRGRGGDNLIEPVGGPDRAVKPQIVDGREVDCEPVEFGWMRTCEQARQRHADDDSVHDDDDRLSGVPAGQLLKDGHDAPPNVVVRFTALVCKVQITVDPSRLARGVNGPSIFAGKTAQRADPALVKCGDRTGTSLHARAIGRVVSTALRIAEL